MAVGLASVGYLGLRREESFASGGAVNAWQPIISEGIVAGKNYFYPSQIMNTRQQQGGRLISEMASGPVSFYVTPSGPQEWWRCGIGGSVSPYSPKGVASLESMVVHVDRVNGDLYTSGDKINSLEFSAQQGDGLICNVGLECKGSNIAAVASPTFVSGDDPYMFSECAFELGGSADAEITGFNVAVNNNLITDLWTGNNLTRREIPATSTTVTGTITRLFTDTTARTLFLANAQTSLKVTATRGANSFEIYLAKINLETHETPLSGFSDIISETIAFTAQVDDASNDDAIKVTIA